jgi:uptake hydrogenase large subunit
MKPDVIRIAVGADGRVDVDWPRQAPETLFIGQSPAEAQRLTPLLFSLCGSAQCLATRLALARAAGRDEGADEADRAELTREAARETLRKLLLDCATVFDGAPADGVWLHRWRSAMDMAALCALSEDYVFAEPVNDWLARGEDGWLSWMARRPSAPAAWLDTLDCRQAGLPLLPELDAAALAEAPGVWLTPEGPAWAGLPREVGLLRREAPHLSGLLRHGALARARLLARLLQLARWLAGACQLEADSAACGDGALARVETARGPLVHIAAIDEHGRICHYRVIPPTAWHSHPRGLIRATLESRAGASETEWRRQLALIDPCVAFDLRHGGQKAPYA